MTHKHYPQRKKSKLIPGILLAVLWLICLILPSQAAANDEEIPVSQLYESEIDANTELSEPDTSAENEEAEEDHDSSEVSEEGNDAEPTEESSETENEPETSDADESTENSAATAALSEKESLPALSDSAEDPNYIVVEKRFEGLSADLIPAAFQVTVSSDKDTYILNGDNTVSKKETDGAVIWTWKIVGAGTGSYSVDEANEDVPYYKVTKEGGGTAEVKAADMAVFVPVHETTCSHTNWPVKVDGDSNVLFAATLTQGGVAVISKEPLSASRRAAVSAAVLKINGPWKTPVYFYSIQEQLHSGTGFELNGATITYDSSAGEIIIGKTSNWQHVATLRYSVSEASNPEIVLINTYERSTAEITVKKSVNGALGDPEKSFDFTVSVKLGESDASFKINDTQYIGSANFSLKNSDSILLREVPVGAAVTVTESDYSKNGYAVSHSLDAQNSVGGNTAVLESVGENGHTLHFINTKDYVPDTGIAPDLLPYLLILTVTAAGSAMLLLRRRRAG